MRTFDPNKDAESPCRRTGDWGFAGYLENGTVCPIGVYSEYRVGVASANAWMRSTPKAERWEGVPLYVSLDTESEESGCAVLVTCHNQGKETEA